MAERHLAFRDPVGRLNLLVVRPYTEPPHSRLHRGDRGGRHHRRIHTRSTTRHPTPRRRATILTHRDGAMRIRRRSTTPHATITTSDAGRDASICMTRADPRVKPGTRLPALVKHY